MKLIKEGFRTFYEVRKAESIKSRDNGEYEGHSYLKAVTFRCERLEQVETEKFGLDDKETIIYFQILCDTDEEVIQLKELLRFLEDRKETLHITGSLPQIKNGDFFVKCDLKGAELLKLHSSNVTPKK
jgi:hypothetical protein